MFTLITTVALIFTKDDGVQMILTLVIILAMLFDILLIGLILERLGII